MEDTVNNKNSEEIKEYVYRICKKFNYDNELATFLYSAITALIS